VAAGHKQGVILGGYFAEEIEEILVESVLQRQIVEYGRAQDSAMDIPCLPQVFDNTASHFTQPFL